MKDTKTNSAKTRTERTRELIFEAFITLIHDKPFDDITITDICEKAGIHRTTFYNHFENKNELFSALLDYTHMDFLEAIPQAREATDLKSYLLSLVDVVLTSISGNKKKFSTFLSPDHNAGLKAMITGYYSDELLNAFEILEHRGLLKVRKGMPLSFLSEFLMSGFVSVCTWWLNSGEPVTKDQLMEYFTDLARYLHV